MENSTSSDSLKEKKFNFSSIIKYKDYYTGDFYLKIGLKNNSELIIINYNTRKLDAEKFSLKLNIGILHKASNLFKKFEKIDEFYDLLIKLIDEKKYKLYINSEKKMIFSIMPNNAINNNKDILFYLNKDNNDINIEYNKVLSDEINKLKKIIDILITSDNNNKYAITDNTNQIKLLK